MFVLLLPGAIAAGIGFGVVRTIEFARQILRH